MSRNFELMTQLELQAGVIPESGVKIESSALNRFQPMNLAQDAIGQIL
jgi:hypothetical protein